MVVSQHKGDCGKCLHFIRLTETEKKTIQPKLSKFQIVKGSCIGACLLPRENPLLLIRRYLETEVDECVFFEQGFYHEIVYVTNPGGKTEGLMISRPLIGNKPIIIFGQSRNPDFKTSIRKVSLTTNCRFCNAPLTLVGGQILRCFCEKCHRAVEIPVSLKTWPWLLPTGKGCVHSPKLYSCPSCSQSKEKRVNLIDIELPLLARWMQEIRAQGDEPFTPYFRGRDQMMPKNLGEGDDLENYEESADLTNDIEMINEGEQEIIEDYLNYVADYTSLIDEEQGGNSFV